MKIARRSRADSTRIRQSLKRQERGASSLLWSGALALTRYLAGSVALGALSGAQGRVPQATGLKAPVGGALALPHTPWGASKVVPESAGSELQRVGGRQLTVFIEDDAVPPEAHLSEPAATEVAAASAVDATAPWQPCLVNLRTEQAQLAPAPVQALFSGHMWRNCQRNATGGLLRFDSRPVTLTYSFEAFEARNTSGESLWGTHPYAPLPSEFREVAEKAHALIERYSNLQLVEADDPGEANLFYGVVQAFNDTDDKHVVMGEALQAPVGADWAAVAMRHNASHFALVAHEAGHAIGQLSHTFDASLTKQKLPIGAWSDDQIFSLMSYTGDGNAQSFGPLDLAAFGFLYGLAPRLVGDSVHAVDDTFGKGALHDDSGFNTLKITSSDRVVVTLSSAGVPSKWGANSVLLSPTSRFQGADISQTPGGEIKGNAMDNVLRGSPHDDTFITGPARTDIHTGGGADLVRVHRNATYVHIADFDTQSAVLDLMRANLDALVLRKTDGGLLISTPPTNRTILLAGVEDLPRASLRNTTL